ncbi:MAG: glycine--tRNA ligase subunit beta, partial [Candidatus Gastranaerophilales bacterium]|nr:glycine--tRNA ligase subunit beta [Candidatus Gastranaerophilales bacterium]
MDNNFLLEILVQELPYEFIPNAQGQLSALFAKFLNENKLSYKEIKTFATPRRLALLIKGLAACQDDSEKTVKGPVLNIAFDENHNYTKAASGFANKNNVPLESLFEKDGYIWAKIATKGKSAKEILEENAASAIMKLQGAHFMRWGNFDEKFSRPIENIVALLNEEVLQISLFNIKAGNKTRGHRFSAEKEAEIKNPLEYEEKLKTVNVIADPIKRREVIIDSAQKCAQEIGCVIDFAKIEGLLDEVTYITEYPVPVICEFKEEYLQIPDIVTVTVMTKHQRYFPLYEKSGRLSNKFITIANFTGTGASGFENIKKGNKKVISARLEDGKFFYEDDIKTSLESKLQELSGMTFQKGLGTLLDKTERIEKLSEFIADELNINDKTDILRAAKLCKADLSTKLVFEFTELQGFIGENYALKSGEKENVALAIKEHYFPLNANSILPSKIEGQIVSIADKIDTIAAVFLSTQNEKRKKRPTGSNDPLGVRRAAAGIVKTIINYNLKLDLILLIKKAVELLSGEFCIQVEKETLNEISDFIYGRLNVIYEKTFENDILAACRNTNPLRDLTLWLDRMNRVEKFIKSNNSDILEAINRVVKITQGYIPKDEINPSLFIFEEEKSLYNIVKNTSSID